MDNKNEATVERLHTASDVGSVKIGVKGKCEICIPNGYGDGETDVLIVQDRKLVPSGANFLTSVEGDAIGIFAYDCGSETAKTLSGRFGVYNVPGCDHGIVVFERWS